MKIYTKRGDRGITMLLGGKKVSKSCLRIETYGTIDELNAYIGLVKDVFQNKISSKTLIRIQENLFVIGAFLATDSNKVLSKIPTLSENDILFIEKEIDIMEKKLA